MRLGRRIAAGDFDQRRRIEQVVGERLDFVGESGREEQVLALRRQLREHALDVVDEAHVEHAVGFVEHENLEMRHVDGLLLHVIEQTARRRHDDIDAALQRVDLRIDADAAEHHGRLQLHVLAIGAHAFLDLRGEFARRREDQRAHVALRTGGGRCHLRQALQDRQREAGGLAGAGLRAGEQVAAIQDGRNGLELNRRGAGVAEFNDGAQQGFGKSEGIERHRLFANSV